MTELSLAEQGRQALIDWESEKPNNFYTSDTNLEQVLKLRMGTDQFAAERDRLADAGHIVGTELSRLSADTNHDDNLPRLERYDGLGRRTESVVFHPSYHEAGSHVWNTGVLSLYEKPGFETLQMGLLYLLAQTGEHGHNCPLACTAGLIKIIQRVGSESQKQRYLPGLLSPDYSKRTHASQFLTEVQGGSDVGANAVVAKRHEDGSWRIHGEKWFCSVIDAQLFLMTARPDSAPAGTRGLGLFLVPRTVNGETNDFRVRRLKRKLGTRAMASAEADFDGAYAEQLGDIERGFKNVVEHVLNTSRIFNAICCAGSMRSAHREAAFYAKHRRAFGNPIARYPLVQQTLAAMDAQAMAAAASSLRLTAQADRMALGKASEDEIAAWRVGVNVNKYFTAIRNTDVVRMGIEVLGGNGAIETFSPLVRLFRDCMVLESWEGTHNVLVQQVMRDAQRYGLHRAFIADLREALAQAETSEAELSAGLSAGVDAIEHAFKRLENGEGDQRFGKAIIDQCALSLQLVALLEELIAAPGDARKRGAIEWLSRELHSEIPTPAAIPEGLLQ